MDKLIKFELHRGRVEVSSRRRISSQVTDIFAASEQAARSKVISMVQVTGEVEALFPTDFDFSGLNFRPGGEGECIWTVDAAGRIWYYWVKQSTYGPYASPYNTVSSTFFTVNTVTGGVYDNRTTLIKKRR